MEPRERGLLALIQEGLPLVERPYRELAVRLGISEAEVLEMLRRLLAEEKIKRIGAVPNHYALGIVANGMCVWNVPDDQVDEVGRRLGAQREVTHCYRRPRHPGWPYNLFTMVHGQTRPEVLQTVVRLRRELDLERYPYEVLFSRRLLKKTGLRLVHGEVKPAS